MDGQSLRLSRLPPLHLHYRDHELSLRAFEICASLAKEAAAAGAQFLALPECFNFVGVRNSGCDGSAFHPPGVLHVQISSQHTAALRLTGDHAAAVTIAGTR